MKSRLPFYLLIFETQKNLKPYLQNQLIILQINSLML